MRLFLAVVVLIAQVVPPAPVTPAADPTPFVLTVLRRDGMVSPFAAFDGKRWSAPWPADLENLQLPISLEAVPGRWWGKAGRPAEMSVWADGVLRGALRAERPTMLRLMCGSRVALRSDYRSKEDVPPQIVQPYPKDGLAISGSQPIAAIETVPRTAPEWMPTAMKLIAPVDSAEQNYLDALPDWKHPLARRERQKVPVEIEMLYRAPMDAAGWTAYYVEAVKRYPPGPEDGDCGLMTLAKGWITTGPDRKGDVMVTARVTYCDRQDATFMLPLGLIKARGRTYWIYQLSGYRRELYFVDRPTPRTIEPEIRYEAGFCGGF